MNRVRTVTIGRAVDFTRQIPPRTLSPAEADRAKATVLSTLQAAVKLAPVQVGQISAHTRIPLPVLRDALAGRVLLAREPLGRILRMANFDRATVYRTRRTLDGVVHAMPAAPVWRQPTRPLPEDLMRIASVRDLMISLRCAIDSSGLPKMHIARQAGMARAQIYRLDPDKPALPRHHWAVRALLETCSVPEGQIVAILEQWHALQTARAESPAPAAERRGLPATGGTEGPPADVNDEEPPPDIGTPRVPADAERGRDPRRRTLPGYGLAALVVVAAVLLAAADVLTAVWAALLALIAFAVAARVWTLTRAPDRTGDHRTP